MKLRQNIILEFNDAGHFINTIISLHEKGIINTDKLSLEIFSGYYSTEASLITTIERLSGLLNFKLLSRNKNIPWTYSLLDRYKEQLDWNTKELYVKITSRSQISRQFIEHFKSFINWKLLGRYGLVRRDINLELLLAYRDKWCYEPSINDSYLDVDPEFGLQGSYLSKRDSIFNNKHIPWHEKQYKDYFKTEIDIYINTLKKYFCNYLNFEPGNSTEFILEYQKDIQMFNADQIG